MPSFVVFIAKKETGSRYCWVGIPIGQVPETLVKLEINN